ncbi:T9SS type A sorting domain-containing protein [Flavobacteriales bacterium]|nr:T9SS type A sorting domain-containing protein [Flavobacteriales bacterium]
MKKLYFTAGLSILSFFAFAQCPTGQTEVTIDLGTDNYGYEIYWELAPTGNNCGSTAILFSGGSSAVGCNANNVNSGGYSSNTVIYEGPWCLTDGASYDIISRDGYGDGGANFVTNIGSWPMYNFSAVSDSETFTFSVVPPAATDGAMLKIKNPSYVLVGNINLEAEIKNLGSSTINSMDVSYTVNGGSTVTQNLSGLNIYALTSYDFIHPTTWVPASTGAYTVELWISNINGQGLDAVPSNDNLIKTINVKDPIPNIISSYISVNNTFTYDLIVNSSNQIDKPRDLDFHPNGDLWVINTGTENSGGSTVKVGSPGAAGQTSLKKQDGNAWHFMSLPSGIAFNNNGDFATSTSVLSANHNGSTFTGPSLWSSDPLIYAVDHGPGTNGSHLDMLHESPYSMGIASEKDNVFWVYDDYSNDIVMYDFAEDHGPGNDDHDDGRIRRFPGMGLSAINQDIVNHLVLDADKKWLYFVDGGNQRILRLDITTGATNGTPAFPQQETLAEYKKMIGFVWEEVAISGLVQPAGIDIIEDKLVVTDHSNGDIVFYDVNSIPALEIGRIQTNEPGIMGAVIGPNGKLWYANATLNKVVKIEPSTIISDVVESQLVLNGNRIFPNPVSNTLHFTKNATFVAVFDINGKLILSANNNIKAIDVSMLEEGVYFIDVDGVKSKFIKY